MTRLGMTHPARHPVRHNAQISIIILSINYNLNNRVKNSKARQVLKVEAAAMQGAGSTPRSYLVLCVLPMDTSTYRPGKSRIEPAQDDLSTSEPRLLNTKDFLCMYT